MKLCNYPHCFECVLPDCISELDYKAMKQREYNLRHPERVRESSRKYYQANKNTEEFKKRNRENQAKWRLNHKSK